MCDGRCDYYYLAKLVVEYRDICAVRDAWTAGYAAGIQAGALSTMTPDQREAAGYRDRNVQKRLQQMEEAAARIQQRIGSEEWPDVTTRRPGGPTT